MTLNEFQSWALKQGQVSTPAGTYPGECVECKADLVVQRRTHTGYCKKCRERIAYRKRLHRAGRSVTRKINGQLSHSEYRGYVAMKQRCYNPNNDRYKDYGGRGVTVCDRWLGVDGFMNFLSDMGERPDGYTLDRRDVNGNYEPSNCRWSSQREQGSNRRNNSKYVGVQQEGTSWRASLYVKGTRHRKTFKRLQDALSYRATLEKRYPA